MNNSSARRRPKPARRGRRRVRRGARVQSRAGVRGPYESPVFKNLIVAREENIKLSFYIQFNLGTAAAGFTGRRFGANSCYSTDPTSAGSGPRGFSKFSPLFNRYRVVGFKYKVECTNKEAFPIKCFAVATNVDPGTTSMTYGVFMGNRFTKSTTCGAITGPSTKNLSGNVPVSALVGSDAVDADDNYSAAVSASPANVMWMGVGVDGLGNVFTAAGTYISLEIMMKVRFYEPFEQTTQPDPRLNVPPWRKLPPSSLPIQVMGAPLPGEVEPAGKTLNRIAP